MELGLDSLDAQTKNIDFEPHLRTYTKLTQNGLYT